MNPTQTAASQPSQPAFKAPPNGGALNATQIQQARAQIGLSPTAGTAPVQGQWDTYNKLMNPPAAPTSTASAESTLGAADADQVSQGAAKVEDSIKTGAQRLQAAPSGSSVEGVADRTGDLLETGLGVASGGVQAIAAPLTATLQKILSHGTLAAGQGGANENIGSSPIETGLSSWAKANPRAAQDLMDAVNVGGAAIGDVGGNANLLNTDIGAEVSKIPETASAVKQEASNAVQGIKGTVKSSPEKALQQSIDAVNPDLSGKKLTAGYKQTVTGGREITPPSIFREQGLTADQQSINLGTRLQDLGLGKNHVENLGKLGTALADTESKLQTALKGDPEVNYNADKSGLRAKLDDIKSNIPGEFSAIKDSKAVFNHAVDFAKTTVAKAEDSISGLRDARTSFDAQAMKEYPSAFKGGKIDTATPAGRAIKTVRDTMNEHLYDTAPNGSDIQKLIGRESDIFRATDNIAPKAAAGEGKTQLGQIIAKHPVLGKYLKYAGITALGAAGGDVVAHATGI